MAMIPVLHEDGSPDLTPCDSHHAHVIPITKWFERSADVGERADQVASDINARCQMYNKAYAWFLKVSKAEYKDGDDLREVPYVSEIYDPISDAVEKIWFIFKADNNGNTYKVYFKEE